MAQVPRLSVLLAALTSTACSAGGGTDPSPGPATTSPLPTSTSTTGSPSPAPTDTPVFAAPMEKLHCEPGTYRGDFSGNVFFVGIPIAASGTVELTLTAGANSTTGEFSELTIQNGVVQGTAAGGMYQATVIGTLNCSTLKIENGGLQNGSYNGIPPLTFEGPITADYVLDTHAFVNGTWNIVDLASKAGLGTGTWAATHVP